MTFTQMLTLSEAAPIVIDGGLGSAAEDRGIDLGHALWSAELIRQFSLKKRLTLQGSIRIMRPATPIRYREKKDGYVAQLVRAHHS